MSLHQTTQHIDPTATLQRRRGRPATYRTAETVWLSLARLMEARGVTRGDLAARLQITPEVLRRWLIGDRSPSVASVKAIATALALADCDDAGEGDGAKLAKILADLLDDVPERRRGKP